MVVAPAAGARLTTAEARRCLLQTGPNTPQTVARESLLRPALRQFRSLTVLVLTSAGLLAVSRGDYLVGSVIGVVVVLNSGRFRLEWRARGSIEALQAPDVPQARAMPWSTCPIPGRGALDRKLPPHRLGLYNQGRGFGTQLFPAPLHDRAINAAAPPLPLRETA